MKERAWSTAVMQRVIPKTKPKALDHPHKGIQRNPRHNAPTTVVPDRDKRLPVPKLNSKRPSGTRCHEPAGHASRRSTVCVFGELGLRAILQ